MLSKRQLFLHHVAQTNDQPAMIEVDQAEGLYIWDINGKKYMDLISGICVSSLGHRHPEVVTAIKAQVDKYLHTMVYGEHIQSPQVRFAAKLCECLGHGFESVYFLMSGSEVVEAAMKLAKRATGRFRIAACRNAYHGSTQGSESLRSDESYKRAFYPLIPGIVHIGFNEPEDLHEIDDSIAAVILEPVQAEAGVIPPVDNYLQKVRDRCDKVGALLIFDEIQTGFGRTGSMFAFQKYLVTPDMILLGKAMGGGVPLSAFAGSKDLLSCLVKNPALGHITTFGGHPLSCAAANSALNALIDSNLIAHVDKKALQFIKHLKHPIIKEIRYSGLMMAIELAHRKYLKHVVNYCQENGVIVDYFLFNDRSFRIAPPLIISDNQIREACTILLDSLEKSMHKYIKAK